MNKQDLRAVDPVIPGDAEATVESEEERKRRLSRERKARQRDRLKKEKQAQATEDQTQWWQRNRTTLTPDELEAMKKQDAEVREILFSMETLRGEDIGLVQAVVQHVRDFPPPHLGPITRGGIPHDWPTKGYWKDPQLLEALYAEGSATERYVKFGLLSGLPDWRVTEFLEKNGWSWERAASLVGYDTNHRNRVSYL